MRQRAQLLVVGGAGFIGSHVNQMLHSAGYDTVVFDNMSRGHPCAVTHGTLVTGDLADSSSLDALMNQHQFDAVLHFAAVTDVGASVRQPFLYYRNNVVNSLNLLEAMVRHSIDKIIFSSSAAIFGLPHTPKIDEEHPCRPVSPYGHSKLMVEQLLADFEMAYGIRFCSLRYFNAAGGDPEGILRSYPRDAHNLIPRLLVALRGGDATATLFGTDYPTSDGTCVRDYVHVWDLAHAHLSALERLLAGEPSTQYNLGNGEGFSVREVIATIERVTGLPIRILAGERRYGDPPLLVADGAKAGRELSWQPQYPSLETIVTHAWLSLN